MHNPRVLICTAMLIVAGVGVAEEVKIQGKDSRAQRVTLTRRLAAASSSSRFYKMDKQQLQEELKRLHKDHSVAERDASEAAALVAKAKEAYESAPDEKKPEELLRMLEAQAGSQGPKSRLLRMEREFEAAKTAYIQKIADELKGVEELRYPRPPQKRPSGDAQEP